MSPRPPITSVDDALRDARDSVRDLAGEARRLGERHPKDDDVLHMGRTLALKLEEAAQQLAPHAGPEPAEPDPGRADGPPDTTSESVGRSPTAGALLLADLRRFLALAADCDVGLTVLVQGAHATKDAELLHASSLVQETVRRTHRWALTRLKTTAPQVLAGP